MTNRNKHVTSRRKGGWAVHTTGASRVARIFGTKEEAVTYAREAAKRERVVLYVHRKDGVVVERRSYGIESGLQRGDLPGTKAVGSQSI